MANHENLEVEVKFLVPDLEALRERMLRAGATVQKERVHEYNVRLDTAEEALLQRDELLRLRQDTAVTLTFKGRSLEAEQKSEVKVREELEIGLTDLETAVAIFRRLGLEPLQVYEKYRETFLLNGVEIVLDELPYGNFAELEGAEAEIKETAVLLGLQWSQRVVGNYLALMGQLKAHHDLPFDDLTFANFAGLDISIADVLP